MGFLRGQVFFPEKWQGYSADFFLDSDDLRSMFFFEKGGVCDPTPEWFKDVFQDAQTIAIDSFETSSCFHVFAAWLRFFSRDVEVGMMPR